VLAKPAQGRQHHANAEREARALAGTKFSARGWASGGVASLKSKRRRRQGSLVTVRLGRLAPFFIGAPWANSVDFKTLHLTYCSSAEAANDNQVAGLSEGSG
jgi:hypothetical protein